MRVIGETVTDSPEATVSGGERFARALPPGTVLLLNGELGGGKTTFVKGLAKGLGIAEEPRSPTFVLVREYGPLIHVDLYRLSAEEAAALPWPDYQNDERILAVEWGSRLPGGFWEGTSLVIRVRFQILDERRRRLELACGEPVPVSLRQRLEAALCG